LAGSRKSEPPGHGPVARSLSAPRYAATFRTVSASKRSWSSGTWRPSWHGSQRRELRGLDLDSDLITRLEESRLERDLHVILLDPTREFYAVRGTDNRSAMTPTSWDALVSPRFGGTR